VDALLALLPLAALICFSIDFLKDKLTVRMM